ncbi:DUF4332 domain-containing protein [Hyphomicrobium sulfonivorans]|uniref:DUF4332 domain-containing protein n=1 Tax=Hyphomicrobium sulfonivorans TaxID=121290 RepID=UPI0015713B16|nr:DUF4332 domain-containing protein [Hyphomicrobium sulfonivorans]MBI1649997.1 DUF4332 domain-containing protein [Hyphomicrobium sulfonivorans]NSL72915.1 DUF4332 domain-containing protein [Hyphomicrobium sulfonivorans]
MSLLYRIVYAAHANGTHHKLALDALPLLRAPDADRWQNLFLKHAPKFLEGSKAPDNTFKDFKNHVLHVRDKYWGGAPEKAAEWYGKLIAELRAEQWEQAVYSAGVLSHYYTDPIHPFHTGQTEAENVIHRACEWSINRSYDDLAKLGRQRSAAQPADVPVPQGPNWLKEMVCNGADLSNKQYERLIGHYDIHRGSADPRAGLDSVAQKLVGDLIVYAAAGFARILDRAFAESGATPPDVSLTAETFVATLQIPAKWVQKKLADAADRAAVLAMYDELQTTGRVEATLPEDDRVVRDLHAVEVEAPRQKELAAQRASRIAAVDVGPATSATVAAVTIASTGARASASASTSATRSVQAAPQKSAPAATVAASALDAPQAVAASAPPSAYQKAATAPAPQPAPTGATSAAAPAPMATAASTTSPPQPAPIAPAPTSSTQSNPVPAVAAPASLIARMANLGSTEAPANPDKAAPAPANDTQPRHTGENSDKPREAAQPRFYLKPSDDVAAGPSIGPKTADRLAKVDIFFVADLIAADAEKLAKKLKNIGIRPDTFVLWQQQAQLVMDVPGLRGTHAQLLTGAGYTCADTIAAANDDAVCAAVLKYAASTEGQRLLRQGEPPAREKIIGWVRAAAATRDAA